MLLGAVLPEMRHEVDALAGDLADLLRVRKEIADRSATGSKPRSLRSAASARA